MGIFLTRLGAGQEGRLGRTDKVIIQRYIHKPLLIDGLKFDFRVYVVPVSVDPLRAYVFFDGLARFCTSKYTPPTSRNLDSRFMHLTNYSLNKFSSNFEHSDDGTTGTKRRLSVVMEALDEVGLNPTEVWQLVKVGPRAGHDCADGPQDMAIQTLSAMFPHMWGSYHNYVNHGEGHASCFQILGFDVLLDHRGRPWLLEVSVNAASPHKVLTSNTDQQPSVPQP